MTTGTFGNPEIVEYETDILIVGGGMAACGAAFEAKRWAGTDVKVTLVDQRTQLLEMVDRELVDSFCTQAREMGLTMRLGLVSAKGSPGVTTLAIGAASVMGAIAVK